MKVDRWDRARDGAPTESALRGKLEAEGYTVERWVYAPGTRFPTHTHDVDKKDAVVTGRFCLAMQGTSVVLEASDRIEVPRGRPHAAEVVGDEPVVSLDAVRASR